RERRFQCRCAGSAACPVWSGRRERLQAEFLLVWRSHPNVPQTLANFGIGTMLLKKDFLRGCRATLIQGREQMRKLDSKNHPAWIRLFQILILQIFFGYFFNSIGHELSLSISSPLHPPRADVADIRPPLLG